LVSSFGAAGRKKAACVRGEARERNGVGMERIKREREKARPRGGGGGTYRAPPYHREGERERE
jgi:hypothetical protein